MQPPSSPPAGLNPGPSTPASGRPSHGQPSHISPGPSSGFAPGSSPDSSPDRSDPAAKGWARTPDDPPLPAGPPLTRPVESLIGDRASDPRGYRRCVGMVLARYDGRVFTGKRRDSSAHYAQMPQGGVDEPESYVDAAVREMEEELGLALGRYAIVCVSRNLHRYDLPPDLRNDLWGGRFRGQMQRWFLLRFLGRDGDISVSGQHGAPPEFASWSWQWPHEAISAAVPFKQAIYRAVFEEFSDDMAGLFGEGTRPET